MAEKTNVPEIRFAGFTDPWEQRKLGEVAHRVIRKNEGNQSDLPLTISAQHGLVDQRDYFNNQVASRDMSGYYLLENGEFAYNKSTSGDSPWGAIKRLTKYEKGCLSTLYICFALDLGDPDFLVTYYETNRWHGAVQMIAAEGARNHGLLNIAPDDFFETVLTLPCSTEEQKQIGCFFTQLNSLITLHQRKYDKLAQLKKSMLDKMFPKPGERFPEIRFAGFTDPWEQRKLGELCTISKGHGYSKADIRDVGTPLILYGRLYTQYESRIENVDTFAVEQEGSLLSKGNEVIVPASGETAEDIAVASSVRRSGIIFGGDLNVVTPVSKLDPDYIALAITYSKAHDDLAKRAQGKSVVHVHGNDIAEVEIPYPSESEQKRISTVVLGLDSLITLHQRKLELLRNTKKSLLDRMFV